MYRMIPRTVSAGATTAAPWLITPGKAWLIMLLAGVVEVADAVDDVLLVAGQRAERARRGRLLFCGHCLPPINKNPARPGEASSPGVKVNGIFTSPG
jgi:hypothetical protein